ncbi:MAG: hypothetical protein J7K94_04820 [Dehalococcoidia bacterium]|nr:hypothetical protein [Dehalococcoidia bacterium]
MYRVIADKLMDLSEKHAGDIAEQWHIYLVRNPRTTAYHGLPRDKHIKRAAFIFRNLKVMYFSKDPYKEVCRLMDQVQYAEEMYHEGIPLHQGLYALVMMRRQIWVYADFQALFTTVTDMQQAVTTINRTILIFDYIAYHISEKYCAMISSHL